MSDLLRRSAVLGLAITSLCTAPRLHGDEALLSGIADKPNSPLTFTANELTLLERRFGVHGPQHGLVQLMTRGVDELEPVRNTLAAVARTQTGDLGSQSRRQRVNPMLVTAICLMKSSIPSRAACRSLPTPAWCRPWGQRS